MSFRYEVRLSGEGGQGLVLAGKILAQAAAIHAGLNATQSQSYGPEARGGASRSEVIISDDDIDYPKAINVDLLLALTQQSFDSYRHDLKKDGVAIVDSVAVASADDCASRVVAVPITKIAEEQLGRALFANIVALGVVVGVSKIVPLDAVRSAIANFVPKGTEEKNLQAFEIGLAEAAKS
jgi:2-oxoglutarate ferredoxin oxidoreductase subunit gamma